MKALLPLFALALLGGVALLYWPSGQAAAGVSGPPAVTPSTSVRPGSDVELQSAADSTGHPGRRAGSEAQAAGEAPQELAPFGVLEGESLTVRLVRASDGSPVAGGFVHVRPAGPRTREEREESSRLWRQDLDLFLARTTERYVTDADGLTRIPEDSEGYLYGLAPGLSGIGNRRGRDDEDEVFEVELHPDVTLEVEVLGPSDPLAGVDVQLTYPPDRRGRVRTFVTKQADMHGIVRFPHLATRVRAPWSDDDDEFQVRLQILSEEAVAAPVPAFDELVAAEQPIHRITLEAPPTGSVSVEIVDEASAPFPTAGDVRLSRLGDDLDERLQGSNGNVLQVLRGMRDSMSRELEFGRAHFAHVALGYDLGVQASFELERDPAAEILRGPVVPGEDVVARLQVGPLATVLAGRLVDADGQPLVERDFFARLQDENQGYDRSWNETTDEEGAFRLRFEPDNIVQIGWTLSIRPEEVDAPDEGAEEDAEPPADPAGLEGLAEGGYAPAPGENDLGDVPCLPRPLLVAGRVVDETGAGVPEASVSVGLQLRSVADPSDDRYWGGVELSSGTDESVETDESGAFALYGRPGDTNRWEGWKADPAVQASGDEITGAEPVRFQPGDEGVVLEVLVAGSLEGRFEIADEDLLDALRIRVEQGTGDGRLERRVRTRDEEFEAENLVPGPWDLVVRMDTEGGEVLRVPGIEVPRGGQAEDPRLDPVDLSFVSSFEITLTSAEGDVPSSVSYQRRIPGATDWGRVERGRLRGNDRSRSFRVDTAHPGLDLRMAASEFAVLELANVTDDREIELEPGLELELTVDPNVVAVLQPKVSLSVNVRQDGVGGRVTYGEYRPDRLRRSRRLSTGGETQVFAWISRPHPSSEASEGRFNRRRTLTETLQLDQVLQLDPEGGPRSVALALTPEALRAAQERLSAQYASAKEDR